MSRCSVLTGDYREAELAGNPEEGGYPVLFSWNLKELILTKVGSKKNWPRLELVKSHVADGFYDRRDIVEATASAVIKSKALYILLDRYEIRESANCGVPVKKSSGSAKLAEIRRKIDVGFYDDPNNLAELAEKIIKKLGLE